MMHNGFPPGNFDMTYVDRELLIIKSQISTLCKIIEKNNQLPINKESTVQAALLKDDLDRLLNLLF